MYEYEYQFRLVRNGRTIFADGPYDSEPFARGAADGSIAFRSRLGGSVEGVSIKIDRRPVLPVPEWEEVPDPDADGGTGCRVCEEDRALEDVIRCDHDCKFFR